MKKRAELVHTYSIIAIDKENGVMGGAVQSHYFSVGGTVLWAEAGTGVIATQAMVNLDYGPEGLAMLRSGMDALSVVEKLVSGDDGSAFRQAAALDCLGSVAVRTGEKTVREAGHSKGEGFSVQANMMLKATVWNAMARAFEESEGELSGRLLSALKAAESEGGDIRGRQSAAIVIVPIEDRGSVRENMILDLRVEDHPEPLDEISRLLAIHKAYEHADRGDLAVEQADFLSAMTEYGKAEQLLPDNPELRFWKAVSLMDNSMFKEAREIFTGIFKEDENWKELLLRLPDAEIVKKNSQILKFINNL